MQHFDVLIIGAGSSGSVLANRLSKDRGCSVALLEAGGAPDDPDIQNPLKWPELPGRSYDWAYHTIPQPFTANRIHEWPRGRVVGGSSCLHAMGHVRGHPNDYDNWTTAGGPNWSYKALLPAFERSEARTGNRPMEKLVNPRGPLDVYLPDSEVSPVVRAYMAAGQALGVPVLDHHNGPHLIGASPNSLNIRDGRRVSVADAYLTEDVLKRKNLTLLTDHTVARLLIENECATGVVLEEPCLQKTLFADRIILAAGAVASPLILMRSGIGEAELLTQVGVECQLDRPQVGQNLQDHLLLLGNVYQSKRPVPPSKLQHSESLMYLNSVDLSQSDGVPDIVLACVVAPSVAAGLDAPEYGTAYTLLCGVTHPTSRGRILLGGPNLSDPPHINPNYLQTEYDRHTMRAALKIGRKVGHHPALDDWRQSEILPGEAVQSDMDLDAFITKAASTHHHPAGTCRMGKDEDAVVDPNLRVNGLDNVFVVDASIMPSLPSGPINSAVVAIAENWAAMNI